MFQKCCFIYFTISLTCSPDDYITPIYDFIFVEFVFPTLIWLEIYNSDLYNINYILIFAGLLLYLTSIYNYGGYRYRSEFSRLNEITSLIKSAILKDFL